MKFVVLALISSILVSCNLFENKSDLIFEPESGSRSGKTNKIDFKTISSRVLTPHCISCHGEYMSYSTVYSQRSQILRSVETNRMPKNKSPLASELKKLLKDWIAAGAPETSEGDSPTGEIKVPVGLSEKMQKLFKKHSKKQPILDDELPLNLSTEGNTFEYDFGEGRVAQIEYSLNQTFKVATRIDLIENTCDKSFRPKACVFVGHVKPYYYRLSWIKHNDPSRVGKVVEYAFKRDEGDTSELTYEEVEDSKFMGANIKLLSPKLNQNIQDYIICDDWNWLKIDKVEVLSWSVEQMRQNSDTKLNENRAVGGMYNFELNKFDENIFRMSSPQFLETEFGRFSLSSVIGEAGSFFYKDGSNQCMVGFKFDFNMFVASFGQRQREAKKQVYTPYHEGQDNTYLKNGNSFFNREVESAQEGTVR